MKHYLLLLIVTLGFISPLPGQSMPEMPGLSVNGIGTARKPPDQVIFTVGVVTEETHASAALQSNNQRMQAVILALESAGLTNKEYQTGNFSIYPIFSQTPQNPPPFWKPTILSYRVNNTLVVKSAKIDLIGRLIDAVNKAGADTISDFQFTLMDDAEARKEAIAVATANAMANAHNLAASANLKLSGLLALTLDHAGTVAPLYRNKAVFAGGMANYSSTTPIESGQVEVTVTVSLLYAIEAGSS